MKCSECGGVNGHADPFCSKLDLKAALANEVISRHAKRYRIEWRTDGAGPDATVFWKEGDGWQPRAERATIYTEAERCAKELPPHGCWVVLNEEYNPAGALNIYQLAAVSTAIRETIEAEITHAAGRRAWDFSQDRQEDFIAEVQRRLTEQVK